MESFKSLVKTSKEYYPWKYMIEILIALLIPATYSLLNRYFIGYMAYENIIVDQSYEALEVVFEVILEMFPIAVLALVAHKYQEKPEIKSIIMAAVILQAIVVTVFASITLGNVGVFIDWIQTPPAARDLAVQYFVVKTVAMPFQSLGLVFIISIKAMKKGKLAILLSAINVIINYLMDAFTISNYPFSLNLGLVASAWNYAIASLAIFIIAGIVLTSLLKGVKSTELKIKEKLGKIFTVGKWSGLESAVRNAGYIFGVVMVVNIIGATEPAAIGGYNTAMWVMWGIALIPQIAWEQATNIAMGHAFGKKDVAGMRKIQALSTLIMTVYMISWAIHGIWTWAPISAWLNGAASSEVVQYSSTVFLYLIIPYIFYCFGAGLKSFWIGVAQPRFIFLSSAIVNLCIYLPLGIIATTGNPLSFSGFLIITFLVFSIDLILNIWLLKKYGYSRMEKWFEKIDLRTAVS